MFNINQQLDRVSTSKLFKLVLTFTLLVSGSLAVAEDVVTLNLTTTNSSKQLRGTVIEYTGEKLVLKTIAGREMQVPGDKVANVRYSKINPHKIADQAFQNKKYEEASNAYEVAMQQENRAWVKREILAQIAWCRNYLGQYDMAGEAFLLIARSDPTTFYLAEMPLAWLSQTIDITLERRALAWIENRDIPYAKLLGASWLLSTSNRKAAIAVLESEENNPNPIIAQLAELQLRRIELVKVTPDQLNFWEEQLQRLPISVVAGPLFLIAQGRARHEQYEKAILTYLRIPILHTQNHLLSSEALLQAGHLLALEDRVDESKIIYRELIADYSHTAAAREAKEAFDQLNKPN